MQEPLPSSRRLGKTRGVAGVILLSVFTIGFYYLLWFYSLWREARRFASGHHGVRISLAGMATLFHVLVPILCGVACIGFIFAMSDFDSTGYYKGGGPERPSTEMVVTALTLFVTGAFLGVVGAFRLPGLVRKMELSMGVDPALAGHPAMLGFLVFVPYAGWLIWMGMTQSQMNAFWRKQTRGVVP